VARAALPGGLIAPDRLAWRLATVREIVPEAGRAKSLVLDVPEWEGHRPGHHLDVRLTAEDGYQAQRSFSIASPPEQEAVTLTVEEIADGEVSPYLVNDVVVGDELEVRGPVGGPFTWSVDDGGPLLLVAGGSGLVPLMAMLRHRAARGSHIDARALISMRTHREALYRHELEALSGDEGVAVRWTFTREPPPDWPGWTGRVSAEMVAELGPPADRMPRVFVCGPTGFVEAVSDLLVDAGHAPAAVRTERFGPS
jgi:ferredoxin-NADP reductase